MYNIYLHWVWGQYSLYVGLGVMDRSDLIFDKVIGYALLAFFDLEWK